MSLVQDDSLRGDEEEQNQTEKALLIGTSAEGVPRRHWRIVAFVGCAVIGAVALLEQRGDNFHVLGQATDSVNKAETKVLCEGWVHMQTWIGSWKPMYAVLNDDGTWLQFESKESKDGEPVQRTSFSHSIVKDLEGTRANSFGVVSFAGEGLIAPIPAEMFFNVENNEERQRWKSAIASVSTSTTDEDELLQSGTLAAHSLEDFQMLKVLAKSVDGKQMLAKFKSNGELKVVTLYKTYAMDFAKFPLPKVPGIPFAPVWEATIKTKDRRVLVERHTEVISLFEHMQKRRVLGEDEVRFYAAELVVYIKACHEAGVSPPGVNLESIRLDSDGHIVLRAEMDMLVPPHKAQGFLIPYLAPELLEKGWSLQTSDWYELGVVVYEMLCGRLPFYNRDSEVLMNLILTEDVKFPTRLGSVAKQFAGDLLAKDPTARLGSGTDGLQSLMNHEFFQGINWDDAAERRLQPPFVPDSSDGEPESPSESPMDDSEGESDNPFGFADFELPADD